MKTKIYKVAKIRQKLHDKLIDLDSANSIAVVLNENGYIYPHIATGSNGVDMDSIFADDYIGLRLELKKDIKVLNHNLHGGVETIDNEFKLNKPFVDNLKGTTITYFPLSLEFNDGQVLTALARHQTSGGIGGSARVLDRKKPLIIFKWFLNKADITKLLYKANPKAKRNNVVLMREIAQEVMRTHQVIISKAPKEKQEKLQKLLAQINKNNA